MSRRAAVAFVYLDDSTETVGGGSGYSTYTFENGDSLTAKFTYDWSFAGLKGVYDVVSGTGAYQGAPASSRACRCPGRVPRSRPAASRSSCPAPEARSGIERTGGRHGRRAESER
jgi:hypothetical protein